MMSKKFMIGSLAVATAGYVVYERRIQSRQHMPVEVSPKAADESNTFEEAGAKTGAKLDNITNSLSDKVNKSKELADYKFQDVAGRVEGAKGDVVGWAADKTDSVQKKLQTSKEEYKETEKKFAENVEQYAKKDEDPKVVQAYNATKDSVSSDWTNIKEGVKDDLQSVKDALFSGGSNKDNSEQTANSQNSVTQTAINSKHTLGEHVQNVKDNSVSILNWGINKEERVRAVAISKYDEALKHYNELKNQLQESKKGLFSDGNNELNQRVEDAKVYLEECKKNLNEATNEYNKKSNHDFNQLADELHATDEELKRKGFLTWLRGKADHKVDNTDEIASFSVVGWGETAEQLAKEELEERLRNEEIGPSEAQRRLDRLKEIRNKGWFTYRASDEEQIAQNAARSLEGWGETASIMAQEEYEDLVRWREAARKRFEQNNNDAKSAAESAKKDAYAKLESAKKELNDQTKRWWQFGKEKNDQLYELAKEKYEASQREYDEAAKKVREWADKTTGKFWSTADDTLHAAKQTASTTHDATQQALDKAQDYFKDEKK